jgi:hypothetical protein
MSFFLGLAMGAVLVGAWLQARHVHALEKGRDQHVREVLAARELGALEQRLEAAQAQARTISQQATGSPQPQDESAALAARWPEEVERIRREIAEVQRQRETLAARAKEVASQAVQDGLANLEFHGEVAAQSLEEAEGQVRQAGRRFAAQGQRRQAVAATPSRSARAEQIAREYSERTQRVFGSTPLRSLPVFPRETPR